MYNKEELRDMLYNNVVDVKFTKTDGSIRSMRCTLMPEFLPAPSQEIAVITKTKRDENPDVLAVWDMYKGDWRSFRVNSVIDIIIGGTA